MGIRYKYRTPNRADYRVGFIKIFVYGVTAIVAFNISKSGDNSLIVLWGALGAHSVMMIYDAFIVVTGKASLSAPSFLDYLIAIQNPEPTFLGLLDIIALIIFFIKIVQVFF